MNMRKLAVILLGGFWLLLGLDCGEKPTGLNLRAFVKDQGASLLLMWDQAENADGYVIYGDDQVIDTVADPEITEYYLDSTKICKVIRVQAIGTDLSGGLDLTPVYDTVNLAEYDAGASGLGFVGGSPNVYNPKEDTSSWDKIQLVLMDEAPDGVDPNTFRLLSPNEALISGLKTGFAPLTSTLAPPPNDTNYTTHTDYLAPGQAWAVWLGSNLFNYDFKNDHFAGVAILSVSDSGATLGTAYQLFDGLRWITW